MNLGRLLGVALLVAVAISFVWAIAKKISRELPETSADVSKETHGLLLASVILFSFVAGLSISIGVRGAGNSDQSVFLVTGCGALFGAVAMSLLLVRSTRCSRDAKFWLHKSR